MYIFTQVSIQSTSKPFTYGLCLQNLGQDTVSNYIGREPSGQVFNNLALNPEGLPHNPMVNSGAIMSAALLIYKGFDTILIPAYSLIITLCLQWTPRPRSLTSSR